MFSVISGLKYSLVNQTFNPGRYSASCGAQLLCDILIGTHLQMGIGDGLIPGNLDMDIYDDIYIVTDDEAINTSRELSRKEGIMCGISSGTNVAAARRAKRSPAATASLQGQNDSGMVRLFA